MFVPIYICIILSMYAIHRFSFFDTDVSTLSLIDADAVAPNSSTRSYTRGMYHRPSFSESTRYIIRDSG